MSSTTATTIQLPDESTYEQPTGLLINGNFVGSADKTTFETINPYNQRAICTVARGKDLDIQNAVQAARSAWRNWRETAPQQRGRLIVRLADLIERDADLLAKIEVCQLSRAFVSLLIMCFASLSMVESQ